MERFINNCKSNNYSPNTIKSYRSILKQYHNSLNDLRLIKKQLISRFDSPNTAWTHYNVLMSYLKWKKDKRYLEIKKIKLPKISKTYMPIFTKKYLDKKTTFILQDSEQTKNKKIIMKFLFETGIRANELKTIMKITKDTILIKGKGNKIREIFHNPHTTKLLKKFIHTTKTLRLWVKEILGKQFSPHSIRRSHATYMLMKGANPKIVMLQLGHEKIETTFRYLQLCKAIHIKNYRRFFTE